MKIEIHNVGKIAEANIKLNGLTVLGGLNDIGKSTIGKIIFSIIKSINNSEQEFTDSRRKQISDILNEISVDIRKRIGKGFAFSFSSGITDLSEEGINSFCDLLCKSVLDDLSESDKFEVKSIFDLLKKKLQTIFSQKTSKSEKCRKAFNGIISSLFKGELHNKKSLESFLKIFLSDDANFIRIQDLSLELSGNLLFNDVTLIESPIILSFDHIIFKAFRKVFGDYNVDLLEKIVYAKRESYEVISDSQKIVIEEINNTLNGKMYFDKEKGDFIFEQDDSLSFKSVNIASGIKAFGIKAFGIKAFGIKAFGIIQLLIIAGVIAPNTVLIIDEPEVHLHPEWQLKYAKLITHLVDMGVFVVVSSHSPYMIEALKVYSDKAGQEKITNFYVGESTEKGTVFKDVTQNLEPLFGLLAIPMQKLAFEDQ